MKTLLVSAVATGLLFLSAPVSNASNPYYYKHHGVYVDISGNGWLSKHDAIKESKRLIHWLKKMGY